MKIMVTGATGFIGKKLLGVLKGDISVLSRSRHNKYPTVICDFEKDKIPNNSLIDIDIVFHLAGVAHDINGNSNLYQKINIDITIQLAELAVKSNVKRFIFISSVKAGGLPSNNNCVDENYQGGSEGVYGNTKKKAEIELLKIGHRTGMHISIIRPSLVYGPNIKGNLKLMLSGIESGWFPPMPEVNNRRSMVHVDDLVRAMLFISKSNKTKGEVYIVTDGEPYSSREIYNTMCTLTGRSIPKWRVPKILFTVISLVSQNYQYKIRKLLGNECYSSKKLEKIGFKAEKTLENMYETSF